MQKQTSHAEHLLMLRSKIREAFQHQLLNPANTDIFESTLIQILNSSEQQRQRCINQADSLKKQAATLEGQASAYSMVGSLIYNVLNGYVTLAQKDIEEREESKKEEQEDLEAEKETSKKKTRKKATKKK